MNNPYVLWFEDHAATDVAQVGGKNAGLATLFQLLGKNEIRVPAGFAINAAAYWHFVEANDLLPTLNNHLADLKAGKRALSEVGRDIRRAFLAARFPDDLAAAISQAYKELCRREGANVKVAVRSSATAEDLPQASFAGQQESYLNLEGEAAVLEACKKCISSLFTDRAIVYRDAHGFDHLKVALSVGVQKLVRSDLATSGVMFTIDTETGFPNAILINAAYGLGENIVKGTVDPDEYVVFKSALIDAEKRPILRKTIGGKEKTMIMANGPDATTRNIDTPKWKQEKFALSDDEILQLARWGAAIETYLSGKVGKTMPMDIEWAKDGQNSLLYIVQARPETVQAAKSKNELVHYRLNTNAEPLLSGRAVGEAVVSGKVRIIRNLGERDKFEAGAILVTEMTDPDWTPLMKRAAGVITDHGGRTCHAAIIGREVGVPTLVGTEHATQTLKDGELVTISCARGDEGGVYEGALPFEKQVTLLSDIPPTQTKLMLNLAQPGAAFQWWQLPADGVGLCRTEFIVGSEIQIHPMALAHYERIKDEATRDRIEALSHGYEDKAQFFVDTLARGVGMIAASQYPRPVIVRMSDFKTNEYRRLVGGGEFEPEEENPMLGFRGASRYYDKRYRDGFLLECRAMKMARGVLGLSNIVLMIPFCRTPEEADKVLAVMAQAGLQRGKDDLQIYVMCEIPSNVILAEAFAERFDGFSIGSNDLTQLILGVDRDSAILAPLFDEQNPAVEQMIRDVIARAHAVHRHVGLCGQAPSDKPAFAEFLVRAGIDSISLNPDSFIAVKKHVAEIERAPGVQRLRAVR